MATYEVTTESGTYQVDTEDQPQTVQQQAPQANVLQQLLQATGNAVGSFVGGAVNEPARIIGRAGQQIESTLSGKPPQNYTWEKPNYLGGNVDIKPAENWGQALAPVVGTTLSMMALKGLVNPPKLMKFDNILTQAKKSKVALDEVRDTLGKAKEIAMKDVKNIPVEFDWKKIPEKVLAKLRDPANGYGIEFTSEGTIPNTLGNVDKIKMALQDMPSTKDFVEAGNMAKRQVISLAGELRDTMVSAANKAGKPELGKALKNYHEFMNNYNLANDHLVDKYGNALGNKLKETFKLTAEPRIKEAWNEIGKNSPEIKGMIKSRNNRELLKTLLYTVPTAGGIYEGGKRMVTGRW